MIDTSRRTKLIMASGAAVIAVVIIFLLLWLSGRARTNIQELPAAEHATEQGAPDLKISEVAAGLSHPWDVVFPGPETIIYSLRGGEVRGRNISSGKDWLLLRPAGAVSQGEGGVTGIALDNTFSDNKFLYVCYNTAADVRVLRYTLTADLESATEEKLIIGGIESQGGRHSGCRLQSDNDGHLWVGTGDSALPQAPQNPASLAGKILRVDGDGRGLDGNLGAPFDNRIFSYGHRNVQGIVILQTKLSNGAFGYSVEHGPDRDDEINYLLAGNYGWDPSGNSYDESVPMTDSAKFPAAIKALWSSGEPTLALSGAEVLQNKKWGSWQERLIVAALKAKQAELIKLTTSGSFEAKESLFKNRFGRIRTFAEAPNGDLYLLTDNGKDDKIIRISPVCTVC